MTDLTPLLDLLQSFGVAGLLLYLWLQERQRTAQWQERYIELLNRLLDDRKQNRT